MLFVFQGAFTIGFQATVWVYPSEILPLRVRQKGSSISTASNWIMNFLVVYITPVMKQNIGWRMYIPFAVFNLTWLPIIVRIFPLLLNSYRRYLLTSISLVYILPRNERIGFGGCGQTLL